MTRIILSGCCGKMGRMITQCAKNSKLYSIVAGVDFKKDDSYEYPIFNNIKECTIESDVIIDFSRPNNLESLLFYCKEKNLPIILCTTGYTEEQKEEILNTSKKIAIFHSANMSIGINIVNNILRQISNNLFEDYDIEIIEKHHNQKVDSPSGTALLLANTIKDSIDENTKFIFGREGNHKREKKEIGIHAIRGGNIIGDHSVIFAGEGECIEITHKAISREVFAIGALKASKFIPGKKPGIYTMDNMLNL